MKYFAIGVEDHYGWANLVSVAVSGPDITVIDKRRVDLIEPNLAASPYHHETLQMRESEAEKLVRAVKASANRRARIALATLITELALATCRAIAIRTPPLAELPAKVAEVHANYFVMCRADGMIYHQALTRRGATRPQRGSFRQVPNSRVGRTSSRAQVFNSGTTLERPREDSQTTMAQRTRCCLRGRALSLRCLTIRFEASGGSVFHRLIGCLEG